MHRSRHLLAVAFLATALCADRAVTAAPTTIAQPVGGTFAGRLVARLSVSLRRSIPAVGVVQIRRQDPVSELTPALPARLSVARQPLSPFQYRMPPPVL